MDVGNNPVVVYALQSASGRLDALVQGKNVIGRSSVPVEGVPFINIESPRAAISRMQSFIEIAPNGDAWITDCNSTNGTYVSVREGTGVRLEQNHYYQLSPGCTVVFGDVEKKFVCVQNGAAAANQNPEAHIAAIMNSMATNASMWPIRPDESTTHESGPNAVAALQEASSPSNRAVPYLGDDTSSAPVVEARGGSEVISRKRTRSSSQKIQLQPSASSVSKENKEKEKKKETPRVCLSGMSAEQRDKMKALLKPHGGKMVDDVAKANVLVVPTPAARTPKFIIAVGLGIPIVASTYYQGDIDESPIERSIVSLKHDGVTYTSATLRKSIFREDKRPLLEGHSFSIASLPAKLKPIAKEIITGCGGVMAKKKGEASIEVTEKTLNQLYDSILRGQRP